MKTPAQRQADRRARLAASDLVEVRGIFLLPALHAALKREAQKLAPLDPSPQQARRAVTVTMTYILQALNAAARALRQADDAACAAPHSPAFADLIESALSAVELAIEEASPQQAHRAVTVPPGLHPRPREKVAP